jgi:hypothetical protein
MTILLVLKAAVVVVFLIMFLRRPSVTWAIGLLTATTAVLLDTFLGTFGREATLTDLGFFFHIISGGLFGGAAVWIWGILRPMTSEPTRYVSAVPSVPTESVVYENDFQREPGESPEIEPTAAFDRRMVYDEIRQRFGREDILDLVFDLRINENDVVTLHQDMNQLIQAVMDTAIQRGEAGALALAVERILTPPAPEHLPRLERITVESPPTILRHYLLSHYDVAWLENAAKELEIDWEQIEGTSKKGRVRNLLLYLTRRNRLGELVGLMQAGEMIEAGDEDSPA